jgi:hypothetical protein
VPHYIEFPTEDGSVLVEVTEDVFAEVVGEEAEPEEGLSKAGFVEWAGKRIAKIDKPFDKLVENAMKKNALPFVRAAQGLVKESGAMEMEVSFGLGISGEVGNVAVGKAGAESNYTVTLKWSQPDDGRQ